MSFMVVVTQRGLPSRDIRQFDGEAVAGRLEECDLMLASPFVSRRHASIAMDGSRFLIRDLGSRNGTRVNGKVFHGAVAAEPESVVAIGPFELRLTENAAGSSVDTVSDLEAVTTRSRLDSGQRTFFVDGQAAIENLAGREFALLERLQRDSPNLVPNTQLADDIWGEGQWDVYMLHNLVRRVRKKIESVAERGDEILVTVPGAGYRLT